MMTLIRRLSLCVSTGCLCVVMTTACAPRVLLEPPPLWPAEWRGRTLYHTPRALIYASTEMAAGEADRLVRDIASKHGLAAPAEAPEQKGLLVVTDVDDPATFELIDELFPVLVRGQSQLAGSGTASAADIETARASIDIEDAPFADAMQIMLGAMAIPIADVDVSKSLSFPENPDPAAHWAAVFPTNALMRSAADDFTTKLVDYALSQPDVPVGARWFIKPLTPSFRGMLTNELIAQRDILIETVVRQSDPVWISQRDARRDALAQWPIVLSPTPSRAAHTAACKIAQDAAKILQDDPAILRVLAAAEYRMGRFDETVENLTRVRSLERKRAKRAADRAMGSISIGLAPSAQSMMKSAVKLPEMNRPNDLAFIAMAQYRLGRPEAANETYRELVELMKADESPSENALFAETQIVLQILPEQATQPVTK